MNEIKHPGLNPQSIEALAGSAKWAKFLAIVGFVMTGLLVIMAFFGGSLMATTLPMGPARAGIGVVFTFTYLIIAAICFVIYFFLYKFAAGTQKSLATGDEASLASGLTNLNTFFKIQGILTIIGLAMMVLGLVMAIVGASIGMMR